MTNAKKNPGAGNARATGRTDRDRSYSAIQYSTNWPEVKKPAHKQYRHLTYSPRSTWTILGPMIRTARRLGLVGLVDDLLELGRSWQRRGVAA